MYSNAVKRWPRGRLLNPNFRWKHVLEKRKCVWVCVGVGLPKLVMAWPMGYVLTYTDAFPGVRAMGLLA